MYTSVIAGKDDAKFKDGLVDGLEVWFSPHDGKSITEYRVMGSDRLNRIFEKYGDILFYSGNTAVLKYRGTLQLRKAS